MIIDQQLQYSYQQALTASGLSSNAVDHGSARNLGVGEELCVVVTVIVAPVSTGTYTATLQTSANQAGGNVSGATSLVVITIPATSAIGARFIIPIAADGGVLRYTQVYYTLGGTNPAITVTAELQPVKMVQNDYYFPRGYVIL